MEKLKKKTNWLKKIAVFVLACIVISGIIKAGAKYYLDNYWTSGTESLILNNCISQSKASVEKEVSDETIKNYCNCNLQKIKIKYKPKEVGTISTDEWEIFANECVELIK